MKMHILGHNPAIWAIVFVGLHGEFFDGREPNREATAEELKMLQYNAQASDILFNGLCPEEFNKISRLENAISFVIRASLEYISVTPSPSFILNLSS